MVWSSGTTTQSDGNDWTPVKLPPHDQDFLMLNGRLICSISTHTQITEHPKVYGNHTAPRDRLKAV